MEETRIENKQFLHEFKIARLAQISDILCFKKKKFIYLFTLTVWLAGMLCGAGSVPKCDKHQQMCDSDIIHWIPFTW